MIWEFYKYEKDHHKSAKAYDVQLNGVNRDYVFFNDPKHQRVCHCQKCGTQVPREVPRLKFDASYYYGAGYYCLSCARTVIIERKKDYQSIIQTLNTEIKNIDELLCISEEVMSDEFYSKKMALSRMIQVMAGKEKK